ncbi:hypothetical protein C8J38_10989 [Rhizobium sp. PP-WC-2G-219]|nr:hypothetical protein C8J32_10820 [Rhizobium sp. PP-CC-3A-592]TCL90138.1 hypothetical protein C8J38_10989 [Rhizobium sp. PP-WC-2G-219]
MLQVTGVRVGGIGANRFFIDQILSAQYCHFGTPPDAGREGHQHQCPVTQINQPVAGAALKPL